MTKAREYILNLVDEKSFAETNPEEESGIVCGYAAISSRPVYIFSQDSSCCSGALSEANCRKLCKLLENAYKTGVPVVGLFDSAGTKISEGMKAVSGIHQVLEWFAKLSGVVPMISIVTKECAGAAAYMAAFGDFVFMLEESCMFLNSPQVIMAETGKTVQLSEIGGAKMHHDVSGICDVVCQDFNECAGKVRTLLSYLPENHLSDTAVYACQEEKAFVSVGEIRQDLLCLCDEDSFFEVNAAFADSVTGLGRVGGRACGIVSLREERISQKDIEKICRFVRICDSFNLPLVTFIDGKSFRADAGEERGGLLRSASKLIYAYCMASVPKVNVVLKKAYGSALLVLGTKPDITIAVKGANIAIMDPQAVATVLYDKEITEAENPIQMRENYAREYSEKWGTTENAARELFADVVVEEAMLRAQVIRALDLYSSKRFEKPNKKHGNVI